METLELGLGLDYGGAPTYDPDALALFARFTTPATDVRKTLINSTILSFKSTGLWYKGDAIHFEAAADSQAARRNWIADQYNLTAVSSPTFTADRGFAGNGTSSYLDTGFNPSTATSPKFLQDSATLGVWDRTARAANGGCQIGAAVVAGTSQIYTRFTGNLTLGALNDAGAGAGVATSNSDGLFVATRTGSTGLKLSRNGGTPTTVTSASTARPSVTLYLGARRLNASTDSYSSDQIAFSFIGAGLSDGEVISLYSIVNTYLQAVGAA